MTFITTDSFGTLVTTTVDGRKVTYIDFAPVPNTAFQFQATFDNNQYNVIITWNLAGQRYYVNIYNLTGHPVVHLPMIGSPLDYDINLVGGYFFTTGLIWRVESGQFEIIT